MLGMCNSENSDSLPGGNEGRQHRHSVTGMIEIQTRVHLATVKVLSGLTLHRVSDVSVCNSGLMRHQRSMSDSFC